MSLEHEVANRIVWELYMMPVDDERLHPGRKLEVLRAAKVIHALYLSEGWQKVESRLVVREKCPSHKPIEKWVLDSGMGILECPLCHSGYTPGTIERSATVEEIVETAEDYWTRPGAMRELTLTSGARIALKEKP